MTARTSRTTNRLHFSDLDPRRFEDLGLNLLFPLKPWTDIRHYGRSGTDGGVDIFAREAGPNGTAAWFVQCKRFLKLGRKDIAEVVDHALQRTSVPPDVLLLVVACDVSRTIHEQFDRLAEKRGIRRPLVWSASVLEAKLRTERPDLLFTFFGEQSVERQRSREGQIQRSLLMKKRLARRLYTPGKVFPKLLIRSTDDVAYPEEAVTPVGISSWFVVEMHGFYHNGVEVLLMAHGGGVGAARQWMIADQYPALLPEDFRAVNILAVGRIPYRNIVAADFDGDDYYAEPHLYCSFIEAGQPYEAVVYYADFDSGPMLLDQSKRRSGGVA
jgi:hypothetical protein